MNCSCNNSSCNDSSCLYKNIPGIIQSANILNVEDPATYIRNRTKSKFKITEEECAILERMKNSQDMTEYKEYLLRPSNYLNTCDYIYIICPNCDHKIHCSLSIVPPSAHSANAVPSANAISSSDLIPCANAVPSANAVPNKESICCSNYMNNKIHDPLCMYYKEN